jgi:hypothetical protein
MSISYLPDGYTPVYTTPSGLVYIAGGDDANCTVSACPIELSVYGYRPSIAASGVLIALYTVCAVIQSYLGFRYKKWGFMTAMLLGCFDEILGYVGRILYWQNPWKQGGFIMQIGECKVCPVVEHRSATNHWIPVLITIGPVFFSAAIYVLLAQIIGYISVRHSRFAPKYVYWVFIPCDILSLILQAVGGAMSSTSNGRSDSGVNIALAGLAFQVFTLVAFAALCFDYFFRSRAVWMSVRWPRAFLVFCTFLAAATVLITIRCCYRVYELSEGYSRTSDALRDQPLFIGLESVWVFIPTEPPAHDHEADIFLRMVILAAYCLVVAHPGFVFKTGHDQLASDETMTEKRLKSERAFGSSSENSPAPANRA